MSRVAWLVTAALWLAPPAEAQPTASPAPPSTDARQLLGVPAGGPLAGAVLDARTEEVSALLRCPVCQGLSVADSPSTMALNMKGQVRELLAAGYDRQQVLTYFERSYGEFVRLQPPLRGINWLLWLAPVGALAAGGLIVHRFVSRTRAARDARAGEAPATPPPASDDAALDPYRARVRALAHGEAGPRAPAAGGKGQ